MPDRCNQAGLFGDGVLPAVALPTIGFVARPCGEWHRYCRGFVGYGAVLPVSWEDGYGEHQAQRSAA